MSYVPPGKNCLTLPPSYSKYKPTQRDSFGKRPAVHLPSYNLSSGLHGRRERAYHQYAGVCVPLSFRRNTCVKIVSCDGGMRDEEAYPRLDVGNRRHPDLLRLRSGRRLQRSGSLFRHFTRRHDRPRSVGQHALEPQGGIRQFAGAHQALRQRHLLGRCLLRHTQAGLHHRLRPLPHREAGDLPDPR